VAPVAALLAALLEGLLLARVELPRLEELRPVLLLRRVPERLGDPTRCTPGCPSS
jgi:hypothetical protein